MNRFIILCLLFMAWAFYELSGGADFDPVATRYARTGNAEPNPIQQPVANEDIPSEVSRISLDLASVNDILRPEPSLRREPARQTPELTVDKVITEETEVAIVPTRFTDRAVVRTVDFATPTEIQPQAILQTETEAVRREVRKVSATRVNVRGGPGTQYSVVNTLQQGEEVEILRDPGDGWVKLRPVGGGPVGWTADYLLGDG
ncbi:MAG: SH3 domain-containing protein [Pseudomonadota bacterium]